MNGHNSTPPPYDDIAYQQWRFRIDVNVVEGLKRFSRHWSEFDDGLYRVIQLKGDVNALNSVGIGWGTKPDRQVLYRIIANHIWSGKLVVVHELLQHSPCYWLLTPDEVRLNHARNKGHGIHGHGQRQARPTVSETPEQILTEPVARLKAQHWLQIEVFDHRSGRPVPGVNLDVIVPEGSPQSSMAHATDSHGRIDLFNLKAGVCQVECKVANPLNALTMQNTLAYVANGKPVVKTVVEPVANMPPSPATSTIREGNYRIAQVESYRVKSGDTLATIASDHGVSVDDITQFNWQTTDPVQIHQCLVGEMGAPTSTGETITFSGEEEQPILLVAKSWKAPQLTTQQSLQIQVEPVLGPPRYFSICLLDEAGEVLAGLPYLLILEDEPNAAGQHLEGETDSQGVIKQEVSMAVERATLVYWLVPDDPDSIVIKEVSLGPIGKSGDDDSLNKRLTNLACLIGVDEKDNDMPVLQEEAMARFVSNQDLGTQCSRAEVYEELIKAGRRN